MYSICSKLHLLPSGGSDIEAGGYTQVPGGPRAEAERRRFVDVKSFVFVYFNCIFRAIALKALDQRLANAAAPPPAPKVSSHNSRDQAMSPSSARSSSPVASTSTGTGLGRPHERSKSIGEMDLGEATTSPVPDSKS